MKIIYIHQYYHNPSMAGSTRSYEMARRLVSYGHEVEMITSIQDININSENGITIDDGIRVHWINVKYSNHMKFWDRIYSFFKFATLSFIKAKNLKGDIVYATSTPLTVSIPGILVSKLNKIPFYFEVRDLWPDIPIAMGFLNNPILRFFAKKLEYFSYKNAKRIVALTKGMKEGIIKSGYPEEKIKVIPNGADLELFDKLKSNKLQIRKNLGFSIDDLIILYPGTIGKVNNLEYLVELAASFVYDNRLKIVVVGDGNERNIVMKKAEELKVINKNIFFVSQKSKKEMPDYFTMTDMVISTTLPLKELEANCANKYFDGIASASCMIVNHGGWQAEELETEECGFRLPRDIKSAHYKIKGMLNNRHLIETMGKRARLLAEKKYDRNKLARELEQLLINNK